MRGKRLGQRAWFLLLLRLDLLEERDERLRVVSRLVHVFHAQEVRFALEVARELHEGQRNADAHGGLFGLIDAPATRYEDERNARQIDDVSARLLSVNVTGSNVGNLVRHHSGQLGFIVSSQDQSRVHVEETARQRESVQFVGVDHFDGEWHLGVRIPHQVLPDAVHILGNQRIADQLGAVLHLLRVGTSHRHLLVQRVPVAHALVAPNIAIADRINVVQGAGSGSILVRLILGLRLILSQSGWKQSQRKGSIREITEYRTHGVHLPAKDRWQNRRLLPTPKLCYKPKSGPIVLCPTFYFPASCRESPPRTHPATPQHDFSFRRATVPIG